MAMTLKVEIAWGSQATRDECENDNRTTHEFKSQAEYDAFMEGVNAMDGWTTYEITKSPEDFEPEDIDEVIKRTNKVLSDYELLRQITPHLKQLSSYSDEDMEELLDIAKDLASPEELRVIKAWLFNETI